jgi:hypothetical protein
MESRLPRRRRRVYPWAGGFGLRYHRTTGGDIPLKTRTRRLLMASLRRPVILLLALMLCGAAPAAAQSPIIGPLCLKMTVGEDSQTFKIFALPMGESQYLLSAVSVTLPWTGSTSVTNNGGLATFTLLAGVPVQGAQAPAVILSGRVNLETGAGIGYCATIDPPPTMDPEPCTTITSVTLAAVSCS